MSGANDPTAIDTRVPSDLHLQEKLWRMSRTRTTRRRERLDGSSLLRRHALDGVHQGLFFVPCPKLRPTALVCCMGLLFLFHPYTWISQISIILNSSRRGSFAQQSWLRDQMAQRLSGMPGKFSESDAFRGNESCAQSRVLQEVASRCF